MSEDVILCERCSYDEADPRALIPSTFEDRYTAVCSACAKKLFALQDKQDQWGATT